MGLRGMLEFKVHAGYVVDCKGERRRLTPSAKWRHNSSRASEAACILFRRKGVRETAQCIFANWCDQLQLNL